MPDNTETTEAAAEMPGVPGAGVPGVPSTESDGGRAQDELPSRYSDRVWQRPWMGPFLDALSLMPVVAQACRQGRVSHQTAYLYRKTDEVFAAAWIEALSLADDLLEQNTYRWGMTGLEVTETRQEFDASGRLVKEVRTTRTDRNPQIAMMLLKGRRPVYRESSKVEHTGAGGGPVQLEVNRMPTHDRMLALLEFARQLELDGAVTIDGEVVEESDEL